MQIALANIVHSPLGVFHVLAALFSMIVGAFMLFRNKGGIIHRRLGYTYVVGMLATNASAFGLYHLFNSFGPFHFAAIIALFTLMMGLFPALKRSNKNWVMKHMYWMHYSVVGLYAAFVSEMVVRFPLGIDFFSAVGLGTALVMFCGFLVIYKKAEDWLSEADSNSKTHNNQI